MGKTSILIVEDEGIVAKNLSSKLGQLGYDVAGTATNAQEAVEMALELRPQLILMDIQLSGQRDGIQAAEAVRARYDVPVIYLTAHSDPATLARAKLTGPFGYILKPFEMRDLATQIELALYKHQADKHVHEQREWLRVTLTSIGDAVIATDAEERITFMNPVAEALSGWKSEEVFHQPLSQVFRLINEQTGQAMEDPVACVLRECRIVPLANHSALVTKDGRIVPIEDSAAPILNAAGEIIGVALVFHDVTDKRRAEEALRASEARYRNLHETMRDGFVRVSMDGKIVEFNRIFQEMTGYSPDELHTLTYQELTPERWHEFESRLVREQIIPRGYSDIYEKEYRSKNGTIFPVELRTILSRDEAGRPIGMWATMRDITERKTAEEALWSSEKRYRSLFSNMAEGFALHEIITDGKGRPIDYRFLDVNQAFEQLTGLKRVDLVGHRVLEVLPGTEAYWIDSYGRVAVTGEPLHVENFSDELGRWYEVIAYQSGPMQFATIIKDTTERKQAEEHARREHRETAFANRVLRTFVEYENETLFEQALAVVQEEMASRHGVFGYISQPGHLMCPSLSKMLDTCEIEGKCIHYPPEKWKGLWARALTEKRSLYTNQARPVPPGHPIIHNNLATPILFHGEVIGLLNIANKSGGYIDADRDTLDRIAARIAPVLYAWIQRKLREDERKEAEGALRQFNETLERQVAERSGLAEARARQLQTLAVELIEAEERERRRVAGLLHDDLQQILASARMQLGACNVSSDPMLSDVEQLLTESIDKSRRLSHELSPAVLHHSGLVEGLNWLTKYMDEAFGLKVRLGANGTGDVDNTHLKLFLFRAVQELLFNVFKHSGVKEAVVELTRSNGFLVLTVSDRGKGLNPQILDNASAPKGLGLLSLRERARYIGGSFVIESTPDLGSRFTFTVPANIFGKDEARRSPIEYHTDQLAEAIHAVGVGATRVLFVDDHKVMRQGLINLIGNQPGIHVAGEASNGREAIEQTSNLKPDVIVMDVSMPVMDGIEATRRIKSQWPQVRVIGLSMVEDEHISQAMLKAGAERFVSKTASAAELLKAIYGSE